MNDLILTLKKIQEEDREILSLSEALEALKNNIRQCHMDIDALREQKNKIQGAALQRKARTRIEEVAFKEHQDVIDKMKIQLKDVKNLKEFHNLNQQISARASQMKSVENQVLESFAGLDRDDKECQEIDVKIADLGKKIEEIEASIASDVGKLEGEIEKHRQAKKNFSKHLQPELVIEYDRLFNRYDGEALAGITDKTCDGCFMVIAPNVMVQVHKGMEIVRCPSCSRILFKNE